VRAGSRNLLTHAAYGSPDDLKLIKGVAEVLEKMLHNIGVYYFWQIAEWTPDDIAHADAQLTAFKGRISRDDWVTQARQFAHSDSAAAAPIALAG
jgi:predicted flap endonuclease-1-like 5' DNA nuclease